MGDLTRFEGDWANLPTGKAVSTALSYSILRQLEESRAKDRRRARPFTRATHAVTAHLATPAINRKTAPTAKQSAEGPEGPPRGQQLAASLPAENYRARIFVTRPVSTSDLRRP